MKVAKMPDGTPEIYLAVQGEGKTIGKPIVFCRFSLCNLRCNFCDSYFTWFFKDVFGGEKQDASFHKYEKPVERADYTLEMSPAEIAEYTNSIRQAHRSVVFTGGEPAIQQIGIIKVIEELKKDGEEWYFEIETNGTLPLIPPLAAHINQFNCSPKLESSGNLEKARNVPLAIQKLMEYGTMPGKGVCFKFVVFMETWEKDLAEIEKWRLQHNVPKEFIYLMPEGITAERIKEASLFLNEVAMTQGYQMSTRLQVLLYGDKRAV